MSYCAVSFIWKQVKRVFGAKRVEVTGGLRILHNEELHSLYSSSNPIMMGNSRRVMRWAGACSRHRREEK
jgi:hypothetical protein